jgi:hypothetical protein
MIISMATFHLPTRWSVKEASKVFESTAPKYLNRAGLIRKHYFLTEDGSKAGGIYLWNSKADAEACYTQEWRAMVTERYGTSPEILFMEIPVTVDNLKQVIETA